MEKIVSKLIKMFIAMNFFTFYLPITSPQHRIDTISLKWDVFISVSFFFLQFITRFLLTSHSRHFGVLAILNLHLLTRPTRIDNNLVFRIVTVFTEDGQLLLRLVITNNSLNGFGHQCGILAPCSVSITNTHVINDFFFRENINK